MDVSINRINMKMADIISEFQALLDYGKYDEAKKAIEDILVELETHDDIGLSDGDPAPDNNFHNLYIQLKGLIEAKESSPAAIAAGNTADFKAVQFALQGATAKIFDTAEVRAELIKKDPHLDEYKVALEDGIAEAKAKKIDLEKQQETYNYMKRKVYPKGFKKIVRDEKYNKEQLEKVIAGIKEINRHIQWINDPAHAANSFDAEKNTRRGKINNIKSGLKSKLEYLERAKGLNLSRFGDLDTFFEDANIESGNALIQAKDERKARRRILRQQYSNVLKRLKDAQNGLMVFKDSAGNYINLKDEDVIKNANLSSIDLTTNLEDGIAAIDTILEQIEYISKNIKNQIAIADQEVEIFSEHVKVIDFENEQLAKDPNDRQMYIDNFPDTVKDAIDKEKKVKFQDAHDKFYGDRNKNKQYKQAWKRFKKNRSSQTETFTRKDGTSVNFKYDTLGDYPEKEDDIDFMQLTTWEERSKKTALATALIDALPNPTSDEVVKAVAEAYGDTLIEKLEKSLEELKWRCGSGSGGAYGTVATKEEIAALEMQIAMVKQKLLLQYERDKDYVKNYNSAHFDVKDTVAVALTGGSAMRARSNQSKKNLGFKDAMGAFFGVTSYAPKADGKRHILRTTIANAFGIVGTPVRALKVAMGATIGGVTAAIGKITGTYDMPTPYKVGYLDRREARLEYYRNHGSTRIGAWFKSLFNGKVKDESGNKVKINDKIIKDRCELIGESIEDMYIRSARDKLINDRIAATKNRKAREIAYKEQARSAEMYEDLLKNNPEYILASDDEKKKIVQRAIQRGVLALGDSRGRKITHLEDSFVTNGVKRDNQFTLVNPISAADQESLDDFDLSAVKGGFDFSEKTGEVIWTNAISRENVQRAKTRGMDTVLRIGTAATLPVIKHFLSNYMIKYVKQPDEVVPDETIFVPEEYTVHGCRPIWGKVTRQIDTTEEVPIGADNLTFDDLARGNDAYWCADLGKYNGPHPSGIFSDTATEIQAAHFNFTDPLTGKHFDFSFSPTRYKDFINSHNLNEFSTEYHDVVSFAGGDNIVDSVVAHMPKETGDAYRRFLEEATNAGNFQEAFQGSTQFAWGIPGASMGQGWSTTGFKNLMKEIQVTKDIPGWDIVGCENYEITNTRMVEKIIEGYVKKGQVVQVPSGPDGKQMTLIAGGMLAPDAIKQALSPVFRRGQRRTKNYKKHYDDGRKKIGTDIYLGKDYLTGEPKSVTLKDSEIRGENDIYTSPLDESGKPYAYESAKLRKDRALRTTRYNGDPIIKKDTNGKIVAYEYDDDDFVL